MAKKDMDAYTIRLTQTDLNDLIINYHIPRDLYPWLPPSGFVMSELPDVAIGIYYRMFDFSCIWIPFSSFLLSVIKHPSSVITDLKPAAGSYSQANVRRLSAHVVKFCGMLEGVLVVFGLSRVWKSRTHDMILKDSSGNVMGIHDFLYLPEWTGSEVQEEIHHNVRPTLQRLPFYCTPTAAPNVVIIGHTQEDLDAATPSTKVLAKAEASDVSLCGCNLCFKF
nr:hypothetical protein [Tanacetum cinerariifolium]